MRKKESTIGKRQNIGTAEVKHGYRYILIKRETSGEGREEKRNAKRKRKEKSRKKSENEKRNPISQRRRSRTKGRRDGPICPFETKRESEKR